MEEYSTQQLMSTTTSTTTTTTTTNPGVNLAPPNSSSSSPSPPLDHHQHHQPMNNLNHHHHQQQQMPMNPGTNFHLLQSVAAAGGGESNFLSPSSHETAAATAPPNSIVKTEAPSSSSQNHHLPYLHHNLLPPPSPHHHHHHHHHQFHYSIIRGGGGGHDQTLLHPHLHQHQHHHHHLPPHQHQQQGGGGGGNGMLMMRSSTSSSSSSNEFDAIKAKIITHPQYSSLLEAYLDCQKVGAPVEVVTKLTEAQQEFMARQKSSMMNNFSREDNNHAAASTGDPELDQFMEAYYDMLVKYREELTRPLQEAMEFMRRIEAQLNTLNNGVPVRVFTDEKSEGVGSSEDDQEQSGGEPELPEIDPRAEDRELKNHLLKKYSGYLSSLKQELSKKKKKGKLPKDARQKLLNWWELHYKWPYPSETEKVALAESTGLDQKQINNWFINQRKRHWKPSEDMQFVVMDGLHSQSAALYMDGHFIGDGNYR